jgi:hypothetical protein
LKFPARWKCDDLRHKLVLTSEEKKVIVFVLAAFVLGVGAKCYRDTHPQPPVKIDKKHPQSRVQRLSPSSSPYKAQRKTRNKNQSHTPLPNPSTVNENEGGGQE